MRDRLNRMSDTAAGSHVGTSIAEYGPQIGVEDLAASRLRTARPYSRYDAARGGRRPRARCLYSGCTAIIWAGREPRPSNGDDAALPLMAPTASLASPMKQRQALAWGGSSGPKFSLPPERQRDR